MSATALSEMLRRSAASTGTRSGHTVPLHYGSAAGELALCMRAVGLVNREDLAIVAVRGDEQALDGVAEQIFEGGLPVGEAATASAVHGGRGRGEELLLAGPPSGLLALPTSAAGVRVEPVGFTAIGVVGPGTQGLLLDLGAYGSLSPAAEEQGRTAAIAGGGAWLLLDHSFALALVEPARALALWRLLSAAGRRFELGYVGAEAAERFELTRCVPPRLRRAPS